MDDFQNLVFVVDRIEWNRDETVHWMKETIDCHFQCDSLVDEDGFEHKIEILYRRKGSCGGNLCYGVVFEDPFVSFPVGTVLKGGPQSWRKQIPDSEIESLEYIQTAFGLDMNKEKAFSVIESGTALTVQKSGVCAIRNPQSVKHRRERTIVFRVEPKRAGQLFQDLLRCVSREDCYTEKYYGGAVNTFRFLFADGTELEYTGVYLHGNTNSVTVFNEFIQSLNQINAFRVRTMPHRRGKEKQPIYPVKEKSGARQKTHGDGLQEAIRGYNTAYEEMKDSGAKLLTMRERTVDLLGHVELLINSIANSPKTFDVEIAEIQLQKQSFKSVCDFAEEELQAARTAAAQAVAGAAGGAAIAALAPSTAMWVATTFGTASTGTAISALSGAAAQSAALAWLGGGALSVGGGGTAAGTALLALAGPVGMGVAGFTLLGSVILFAHRSLKRAGERKKEIEKVKHNTERVQEYGASIRVLLSKTDRLRAELEHQYQECMTYYGCSFLSVPEHGQLRLAALVNQAKALSVMLTETVKDETDEEN